MSTMDSGRGKSTIFSSLSSMVFWAVAFTSWVRLCM